MSYGIYCYRIVLCKWQNRAGAGAGDGAGAENKEFRLRNTGFVRDPEVLRVKMTVVKNPYYSGFIQILKHWGKITNKR